MIDKNISKLLAIELNIDTNSIDNCDPSDLLEELCLKDENKLYVELNRNDFDSFLFTDYCGALFNIAEKLDCECTICVKKE